MDRKIKDVIIMGLVVMMIAACFSACRPEDPSDEKGSDIEQETVSREKEKAPSEENAPDIDYLILVDGDHALPDDWEDRIELVYMTNAVGDVVKTEKTAYYAYLKLKEELEKENIYVDLDSAYRSVEEQQKIVDDFTEKYGAGYARTYAAVPGHSEHHTGLALDLFLIVDGNIVYENEDLMKYPEIWEKIHAKIPDHGFILRYPGGHGYAYEPWHIRYVGTEAAREMYEKNMVLEDYLEAHQESLGGE